MFVVDIFCLLHFDKPKTTVLKLWLCVVDNLAFSLWGCVQHNRSSQFSKWLLPWSHFVGAVGVSD